MKSMFVSLMGVAVFGNHKIDELTTFYDGLADIGTNVNGEYQCETAIADQLDLLCDGFRYCEDHGSPGCVHKDAFKRELDTLCGQFDTFEYNIRIHENENAYDDNSRVSLTFTWKYTTNGSCIFTQKDKHVIKFNDNGLITKLQDTRIGETSKDCPTSNGYEPTQEYEEEEEVINGYTPFNEIDQITAFYDGVSDIATNVNGEYQCGTAIEDQLDLLCDGFTYCEDHGSPECVHKDAFKTGAEEYCGQYDTFEYNIRIHENENLYDDNSRISLTVTFTYTTNGSCIFTETEKHVFNFNDNGLITKLDYHQMEASKDCSPSNGHEPTQEYEEEEEVINDYTHFNEIDRITIFYDGLADIAENVIGEYQCETAIVDELDLLSDDFIYCEEHDLVGHITCMNKTAFVTELEGLCGQYEFDYEMDIHTHDTSHVSLTWTWHYREKGNPCIVTVIEEHMFNFNDNGLITNFYDIQTSAPSIICPSQPNGYEEKEGLPPVAGSDYDKEKEKKNEIYAMNNQFASVLCKKQSDKMSDITMKQRFCDNIEYEAVCDNDYSDDCKMFKKKLHGREAFLAEYGQFEDMLDEAVAINDDDNMLKMKYRKGQCQGEFKQRIDIEYDSYNSCISKWTEYMEEITITDNQGLTDCDNSQSKFIKKLVNECTFDDDAYDDKEKKINKIKNQLGRVWCKSNDDNMNDISVKEKFCDNIEYQLLCNGDSYDCNVFGKGIKKVNGKQAFLDEFSQYENLFDEVTINNDDNSMLNMKYRKGECYGQLKFGIEIEYDSKNECISKWIDDFDNVEITDKHGLRDCDNSQAKLFEKLDKECTFDNVYDAEPDTFDYDKEKENKIYAMNNQFGRVLCKKESDKMNDFNMKKRFCPNMEYEAVCNDNDSYDCTIFKQKLHGRQAFLDYYGQYENMFDDAIVNSDEGMLTIKYHEGRCKGKLKQRIEIEYDSYNSCISKWTEYIEEIIITDNQGLTDCDNSPSKFIEKLANECAYDDKEKPETGYGSGSGLDSMVHDEEANKYNNKEEDSTKRLVKMEREDKLKSFYEAAFECRLKQNQGNTQILDIFMAYLDDSCKLCVVADDGKSESCYNKDRIREVMSDRYSDDNESIDYEVDITYNDGDKIQSKCTSRRRKSNGCIVIKEEYDECSFNSDGSIKEFKITRSNKRTECNDNNGYDNGYEQE